jgi:uncharacterized membrane protein YkoI
MNKLIKLATVLVVSGGVMSGAYVAHASEHQGENDAVAINTAKVSMDDAVKTALSEVPGKPTLAEFENEDGRHEWKIEISSARGVYDVTIDAETGRLLHKSLDKPDHEEEDGED